MVSVMTSRSPETVNTQFSDLAWASGKGQVLTSACELQERMPLEGLPTGQAWRSHSVMRWFACSCVRGQGPALASLTCVGDGQGQGFQLGDQRAEPAVVVEPLPVVVELVVGDEAGDGLAADLAGPLPG